MLAHKDTYPALRPVVKVLIQPALAVFFNFSGKTRTTLHPERENVDKFWSEGAKDLNSRA